MDGIEDQPGENTDCRSEAERRQPGFSGIHVSLRPGSARPTRRYLNVIPSKKAMKKERAALREMTSSRFCFKPIPALIQDLNRNLQGWAAYFIFGYPSEAYRNLNYHAQERLRIHLRRRRQRPYRVPKGVSLSAHLRQLGLRPLVPPRRSGLLFT